MIRTRCVQSRTILQAVIVADSQICERRNSLVYLRPGDGLRIRVGDIDDGRTGRAIGRNTAERGRIVRAGRDGRRRILSEGGKKSGSDFDVTCGVGRSASSAGSGDGSGVQNSAGELRNVVWNGRKSGARDEKDEGKNPPEYSLIYQAFFRHIILFL